MNLEKLNYLMVLAEEQNVTKAARRLFIAQPTLTTYINKLERSLGFKLFDRSANPVKVSKAGKAYIKKMHELLLEEQALIGSLQKAHIQTNLLRIGIGQINSETRMPELIPALLKKHPFLNISIRENAELNSLQELKDDKIDLLFGHMPVDTVNFHYRLVFEQALRLIVPINLLNPYEFYPQHRRPVQDNEVFPETSIEHPLEISPEILSNMPLIEPNPSQGLYLNLKSLMNAYSLHPIRVIQTSNMITATALLKKGLGYMYTSPDLPDYLDVKNGPELLICKMPKMPLSRKYYALYKPDNPNIALIMETISIMQRLNEDGDLAPSVKRLSYDKKRRKKAENAV